MAPSYGRRLLHSADKLDSWTNGEKLVLVANELYHGEPASIPTVTCMIMADQTSAGIAMEMNEIDVFSVFLLSA